MKELRYYGEGDTVTMGSLTIQVMETPGHSPGSVTLMVGDVLFTGDTLFCGSMGRTDLQGGSYSQIMASLKRLGGLEGEVYGNFDLFMDPAAEEKEKNMQNAIIDIKRRFGKNSLIKAMSLQEKATGIRRNNMVGGHNGG